jgi:hypothetical protein
MYIEFEEESRFLDMDLRKEILKEHSMTWRDRIIAYVGTNKKRFADLIDVYLAGPYRVTQRASWPISCCVEQHPELIEPHYKKLLAFVIKPGVHVAVRRNTMRLLQFVDIPKKFHGHVAEICFNFLNDKKETVAVQVFAMTVLANLAKHEPDLANELRTIIEDRLPYATAGFRSRASKVLKALRKV